MRVLHVAWEYPPSRHGGLGRALHGLAVAQAAAGADVTVVATASGRRTDGMRHGVRVVRPGGAAPQLSGGWEAVVADTDSALAEVAATTAAGGADVVHTHDWMVARAARAAASAAGAPLVLTVHGTERGRHQGWVPPGTGERVDAAERALAGAAARVVVCSRDMAREVTGHLDVPEGRVGVVPNAPSAADLRRAPRAAATAARARLGEEREPLVVVPGRLEYEKGGHVLLEAVAALRRRVRVVFAGDGSQDAALGTRAHDLGVTRTVTFAGYLQPLLLRALLRAADIVVVPSLYEPFGLAATEAMAAGTPLVASRVGGLAEQVEDGVTGLLVSAGDAAELREAISAVLDDPRAAAERAHEARRRLLHGWRWADAAAATLEIYGSL